ncbi:Zn(II)2Cys6 transcription factor domain-containing protein [Aspergillus lucknowensis]|uniref:Zn(2)-C6 fungal-type domain-containing protein n=1 Tax=Aspergillus lucknowensis TaxID=176173 RepID=A0ABR4M3H6_9EURO
MTTLRKACRNCTVSKRKCVVQLPKCTRCAQRGLECMYDLEPLNVGSGQSGRIPRPEYDSSVCIPGYCVMRSVSRHPSHIDPAVCRPGKKEGLELLRLGYHGVPDMVNAGQPAHFVHPKLRLQGNRNHFAELIEMGKDIRSYETLTQLMRIEIKQLPIKECLTALQALLVCASFLFTNKQMNTEVLLDVILDWTRTLLASAQTKIPRDQSPWQAWLFGESVRRTIIMSYGLVMALTSFKYGYCANWLFLESLPFDARAGLWMAKSPQAWISAAQAKFGEDVGERLVSFHEFGESLDGSGSDFHGDTFLTLLAYIHNGIYREQGGIPRGN